MEPRPSWQSTVIGVALIGSVTGIFIVVYAKGGIDPALKAWAAIGTLVGVVTGAIPTYFFGKAAVATAQASATSAHGELDQERRRRAEADQRVHVLTNLDSTLHGRAQAQRPDLFS